MRISVELSCIKADMPYFTDNEKNVYYVLSSGDNQQHSLLPVKGKEGLILEVSDHFKFDSTLPFLPRSSRTYSRTKVYLVDVLPSLKDIRHNLYYPSIIAIRVKNITCDDLKILSAAYISYRNQVFVSSVLIEGADADTFFNYPDSMYSKDKNSVYYRDRIVRKANPETFEIISPQFQKDDERVWYMGSLLYADSKTFRVFSYERSEEPEKSTSLYACDKKHVFYQYLILDDADLKTFRVLKSVKSDELYGVDEKRVFYHHMYLEYADADTFRVVSENDRHLIDNPEVDAYDKNYMYACGNKMRLTDKEKEILFLSHMY